MKTQAIVFPEANSVEFREIEMRDPIGTEVGVRTLYTGVSTGTETRILAGNESEVSFPLIPGYENVGIVEKVGDDASIPVGTAVVVAGPGIPIPGLDMGYGSQIGYIVVDQTRALVVPESVDPLDAVYAKVAGIAGHGARRAAVAEGDMAVVVGLGLIGHLVVQHAVARGATVVAIDIDEERRNAAKSAGATVALDGRSAALLEEVQEHTAGGATVAFDATGRSDTIRGTAHMLRPRPWNEPAVPCSRLVIQGSPQDAICFFYNEDLFDPEIDIITSRDTDLVDLIDALSLMENGKLDPKHIHSELVPVSGAAAAYRRLQHGGAMRVLFDWSVA